MNDVLHVLDCAAKGVTFQFDRVCVSEFLTMTAQMIDRDAQIRMVDRAVAINNFFSIDSLYFYLFCGLLGLNLFAIIANRRKR